MNRCDMLGVIPQVITGPVNLKGYRTVKAGFYMEFDAPFHGVCIGGNHSLRIQRAVTVRVQTDHIHILFGCH